MQCIYGMCRLVAVYQVQPHMCAPVLERDRDRERVTAACEANVTWTQSASSAVLLNVSKADS